MSFAHLFWGLSAAAAALFFLGGFAAAALRRELAAELAVVAGPPSGPGDARRAWDRERAGLVAERDELARRVTELDARCAAIEDGRRRAAVTTAAELAMLRHRLEALDREALAPPISVAATPSTSFQTILDPLGRARGLRSAVLGDALGLPIASLGEHPESLAGFCGFLAQAATRASDFLPLGHVRRIVLEDDGSATLTACSLNGSDFFVATLTSGPGPEFLRMAQVLSDASSFLVERSRA